MASASLAGIPGVLMVGVLVPGVLVVGEVACPWVCGRGGPSEGILTVWCKWVLGISTMGVMAKWHHLAWRRLSASWEAVLETWHWDDQAGAPAPAFEGADKGSRRHLRRLEVPEGRIEALPVAACVRAPVCFDCDCGYGSRGGKGDRARVLRGAKRFVRDARLWNADPVGAL
ncbi:hypothetical protein PtrM4_062930 [Pyrenophora tritici-repentis]|uniref:Uncharacterized protein n=1 Tax=Pyrenophora tritici-repentis TaxID=45151 RepID=A0A834S349_9PLEO|nr:hypothetical protein PtrM4_062930 [Pyrenophora tritici-repentis]